MIQTTHIQEMLVDALKLAGAVDRKQGTELIQTVPGQGQPVEEGLRHAATLARHAAAELEMELDALRGWAP